MALSTADTPHEVRAGLTDAAHAASTADHGPRDRGIIGAGSSRPVAGQLHIVKGMAGGESRNIVLVHQTRQLLNTGQPPP